MATQETTQTSSDGQVIQSRTAHSPNVSVDSQTVRWLEQAEEFVENSISTLAGFEWKEIIKLENGKQVRSLVQEKVAEPVMNGEGLHYLKGELRNILKKENWLSNITEQDAIRMADVDEERILIHLAAHEQEYSLSPENLEKVQGEIAVNLGFSYRRPVRNLERKHLFGSFGTDESMSQGQQQQQGGILSALHFPKFF